VSDAASQAIEAYNRASREVASLYRERGDLNAVLIENRVSGYQQAITNGATVSDARHAADLAGKPIATEVCKLDGDIDGHLTELRYLDRLLDYLKGSDA
jgi:hypothetical protein